MKTVRDIAEKLKREVPTLALAEEVKFSDDDKHTRPWREGDKLIGFITWKFVTFLFPLPMANKISHGSLSEACYKVIHEEGGVAPVVCYGWQYGRRDVMVSYQDRLSLEDKS